MTELAGGRGPRGAGIGPGPRIIWRREARRSWHRGRWGRRWGARQPRAALAPDRRQRRWYGGPRGGCRGGGGGGRDHRGELRQKGGDCGRRGVGGGKGAHQALREPPP